MYLLPTILSREFKVAKKLGLMAKIIRESKEYIINIILTSRVSCEMRYSFTNHEENFFFFQ